MTLNDTAVLSGGYHPTGTITFTLYQGSTLVDTETVAGQRQRHLHDADRLHAADDRHGDRHLPVGRHLQRRHQQQLRQRQQRRSRAGDGQPGQPDDRARRPTRPRSRWARSSVTLNDTAALAGGYHPTGTITFTLLPAAARLVDTETVAGQRQRHLHDADRLHAADHRHGDRHLPVGRHLQRRHQQQLGQRQQRRGRAGDGQPGQPDAQRRRRARPRSRWARRR